MTHEIKPNASEFEQDRIQSIYPGLMAMFKTNSGMVPLQLDQGSDPAHLTLTRHCGML